MEKILFISVDGQQIYLESLFLPILSKLNDKDRSIVVLQFCLNDKNLKNKLTQATLKENIQIYFGRYFNFPPIIGSFFFIFYGAVKLFIILKKHKNIILMPRSLIAGAMVLMVKPFLRDMKIIFETDGLVADERVDFGSWSKKGIIYKLFRKIEKKLVNNAVAVTTRTQKAKDILISRTDIRNSEKITVIPNGKEMIPIEKNLRKTLRIKIRNNLNISPDDFVFIYIGSIGQQYEPKLMIQIFNQIKQKINNIRMIILTPNQDEIKEVISKYKDLHKQIFIKTVHPNEIKEYVLASDIGFALRTPSFSQQGICPIKLIEYLMMGIPVISNTGVGDLDNLYKKYNIGYIVNNLKDINFKELLEFILEVKNKSEYKYDKIRAIAEKEFSLNNVTEKYKKLFNKVPK